MRAKIAVTEMRQSQLLERENKGWIILKFDKRRSQSSSNLDPGKTLFSQSPSDWNFASRASSFSVLTRKWEVDSLLISILKL